jgi:hypothetical protein
MPRTNPLPAPVSVGELSKIADASPPQRRITARAAIKAINEMLRDAARNDHTIGDDGFHESFPKRGDTISEVLAKKVETHFESAFGYHVEAVDHNWIDGGSSGWLLEVSWWPSN